MKNSEFRDEFIEELISCKNINIKTRVGSLLTHVMHQRVKPLDYSFSLGMWQKTPRI